MVRAQLLLAFLLSAVALWFWGAPEALRGRIAGTRQRSPTRGPLVPLRVAGVPIIEVLTDGQLPEASTPQVKSNRTAVRNAGSMTMWADNPGIIVGGSCEYADADKGGVQAPSATSPYVSRNQYCAANGDMYQGGLTCGNCYRVSYDGSPASDPGRPGSSVIQIVNSGADKTFDCEMEAFNTITGARTGIFPITWEQVDCDVAGGGAVATVLEGNNAWYTKVIFSNMRSGVTAARITIGGQSFDMTRAGGATWSASPGGKQGSADFSVQLSGGEWVQFSGCFGSWPVASGSHCNR